MFGFQKVLYFCSVFIHVQVRMITGILSRVSLSTMVEVVGSAGYIPHLSAIVTGLQYENLPTRYRILGVQITHTGIGRLPALKTGLRGVLQGLPAFFAPKQFFVAHFSPWFCCTHFP